MHAIRSRLATSAVTALLALTCACPVATATEETLTDLTPNGGEDTGALVLEETGVPEGTENTDEETNTDGPADDEYPLTSSEPQETGFGLTSTYVTNADENPSYAASCVYGINIHGNLTIELNPQMLIDAGFAVTDILTVSINGSSYDLPFCTKFSEVPIGESCIYQVVFEGRDLVSFCTNGGSFVESFGLAHSVTDEAGNATWVVNEGVGDTIDFTFTLKERAGNADAADIAALSYTDKREDYPHLTDEQFANFRAVVAGNISEGVLYRSASPVDPRHNRNGYADDAMKRAGVTHVINLADTEEKLATFAGYDTSYFSQVSHIALAVSMNLSGDQLQRKYIQAIRYIIDNPDGVFAFHCLEGKDRTGIFVALLECLGGATLEEVVDDYMVTYYNYYGVEPGSDLYDKIWRRLIKRQLEIIFGCDDLTAVSLPDAARQYLRSGGLSDQEANTLHEILTRSSAKDPEPEPEPAPQPEPEPEPAPQPEPEPQPEPAPRPTPNPRPSVVPYDPWTQVPTYCPIPQPQPYVLPYDLPYDYRYDLPRSESHVLPNNLVYDLSQRFPYVLPYGNMSAVSRPEVRTSQPFAIVSQPRVTRRSSPAYSIVGPTTSRPARSLWQYAYPYDTTGLPYGYPSYHYYGNRSRAYRRSRVNAWYGLMPYILGSRTDLYPWQWDWWAKGAPCLRMRLAPRPPDVTSGTAGPFSCRSGRRIVPMSKNSGRPDGSVRPSYTSVPQLKG